TGTIRGSACGSPASAIAAPNLSSKKRCRSSADSHTSATMKPVSVTAAAWLISPRGAFAGVSPPSSPSTRSYCSAVAPSISMIIKIGISVHLRGGVWGPRPYHPHVGDVFAAVGPPRPGLQLPDARDIALRGRAAHRHDRLRLRQGSSPRKCATSRLFPLATLTTRTHLRLSRRLVRQRHRPCNASGSRRRHHRPIGAHGQAQPFVTAQQLGVGGIGSDTFAADAPRDRLLLKVYSGTLIKQRDRRLIWVDLKTRDVSPAMDAPLGRLDA